MILPSEGWTKLSTDDEVLAFMKGCGLAASSANRTKNLVYAGFYSSRPTRCTLVGHMGPSTVVIEVLGEKHCIHIDHLKEMQRGNAAAAMPTQYVVLDIETTGFNSVEDSIIEIAAVRFRNGAEVESFSSLVRAEVPLPLDIQDLTGITPDMLTDAPPIGDVLADFLTFIGADPLVGHNIKSFDLPFLRQKGLPFGLKIENDLIDTLPLAKKAYPKLPYHSLGYLKDSLAIKVPVSHRALPDVLATGALYQLCADRLMVSSLPADA